MKLVRIAYTSLILPFISLWGAMVDLQQVQQHLQQAATFQQAQLLTPATLSNLQIEVDTSDSRRIQIYVPRQHECAGPGEDQLYLTASSCGYHALYNGMKLALAQIYPLQRQQFLTELMSKNAILQTFGTLQSQWRSFIMRKRLDSSLRDVVRDLCLEAFKVEGEIAQPGPNYQGTIFSSTRQSMRIRRALEEPTATVAEFALIYNRLRDTSTKLLHGARPEATGFRLIVNTDTFLTALEQTIDEHLRGVLDNNRVEYEALLRRIGEDRQHFSNAFFRPIIIDLLAQYDQKIYQRNVKIFENTVALPYGKWLLGEEIPALMDFEQQRQSPLHNVNGLRLCTYNDTANIGFQELVADMARPNQDVMAIIAVYIGDTSVSSQFEKFVRSIFGPIMSPEPDTLHQTTQRLTKEKTNGHWITLLVSRINGQTTFLITDSSGSCRFNEKQINEIIEILDGRRPLANGNLLSRVSSTVNTRPSTPIHSPRITRHPSNPLLVERTTINPAPLSPLLVAQNQGISSGTKVFLVGMFAVGAYFGYKWWTRPERDERSNQGNTLTATTTVNSNIL